MLNQQEGQDKAGSDMFQSGESSRGVLSSGRIFSLWAEYFKTIGAEIQETVQETEKEFLAIGDTKGKLPQSGVKAVC